MKTTLTILLLITLFGCNERVKNEPIVPWYVKPSGIGDTILGSSGYYAGNNGKVDTLVIDSIGSQQFDSTIFTVEDMEGRSLDRYRTTNDTTSWRHLIKN